MDRNLHVHQRMMLILVEVAQKQFRRRRIVCQQHHCLAWEHVSSVSIAHFYCNEFLTVVYMCIEATTDKHVNGHSFKTHSYSMPTWCDKCGKFLWGLVRQGVQCKGCNIACIVVVV